MFVNVSSGLGALPVHRRTRGMVRALPMPRLIRRRGMGDFSVDALGVPLQDYNAMPAYWTEPPTLYNWVGTKRDGVAPTGVSSGWGLPIPTGSYAPISTPDQWFNNFSLAPLQRLAALNGDYTKVFPIDPAVLQQAQAEYNAHLFAAFIASKPHPFLPGAPVYTVPGDTGGPDAVMAPANLPAGTAPPLGFNIPTQGPLNNGAPAVVVPAPVAISTGNPQVLNSQQSPAPSLALPQSVSDALSSAVSSVSSVAQQNVQLGSYSLPVWALAGGAMLALWLLGSKK